MNPQTETLLADEPTAKQKHVLILDSTQICDYLTCPMFWNLRHQEHLGVSTMLSEPIRAGSFGHVMLETYYKNLITLGAFQASKLALDCDPTEYNLPPDLVKLIRVRFDLYWKYYAALKDIVPDTDDKGPLVERGFSYKLFEDDDFLFVLEGKLDVVGQAYGQHVVMDHKFQFRRRDLYQKRIQFRNYTLVTEANTMIVNYVRLTKEVSDTTFSRDVVTLMANKREWWRSQLIEIFHHIALTRAFSTFQHNWDSCEGKYGYPCDFAESKERLGICEHLEDATMLDYIKKNQYVHIEESNRWKPW